MSSRKPLPALLRMVLMTLLAIGLCTQPALAAICAIDDACSALGNDADSTITTANVDASTGAGDCCSNPSCSDCCLHAVGLWHCAIISVASVMPILHGSQRVDEFRPRDYPVDIRPPIAR